MSLLYVVNGKRKEFFSSKAKLGDNAQNSFCPSAKLIVLFSAFVWYFIYTIDRVATILYFTWFVHICCTLLGREPLETLYLFYV